MTSTGPDDVREPASRRLRAGAALALLLLLLGVVAAASGGGEPLTGREADVSLPSVLVDYAFSLAIVVGVAIVVLSLIVLAQAKGPVARGMGPGHFLLGVFLFLLLVAAATRFVRFVEPQPNEPERAPGPGRLEPAPSTVTEGEEATRSLEFRWEVALIAGVAAAAGLAYALRRMTRDEPEPGAEEAVAAVTAVLDEALDDLRAERDARRAVIAAYARLEQTLARHGLPRRPAEAPLEYLSRILLELEVAPEAVLDLTDLFEQAKFSRRRIDAAMKEDAIGALVAVRDDLRAAA